MGGLSLWPWECWTEAGWCPSRRFMICVSIFPSFSLEPIPGQADHTCRSSQIFGTCWSSQLCPGLPGLCRLVRTQPVPGRRDQTCRSSQIFGTCWSSQLCPGFRGSCRLVRTQLGHEHGRRCLTCSSTCTEVTTPGVEGGVPSARASTGTQSGMLGVTGHGNGGRYARCPCFHGHPERYARSNRPREWGAVCPVPVFPRAHRAVCSRRNRPR